MDRHDDIPPRPEGDPRTSDPAVEILTLRGSGGVTLVGDRRPGRSDALPVLLLHGGGQTRHSWGATAARLAASGREVITMDARGHGDSDWDPAGDYSMDAFASDVEVVSAMLDRPPVLIGASLGGTAALLAAGEHPGLASALVLVDVVVALEPAGVARILAFLSAHPDGFASLEEVADAIAAYNPLRRRPRNLDGLRKNVRRGEDGRWHWHWDPAFVQIDDEPQRRVGRERLRAAAARIEVPTLIVRGAQSEVVSEAGLAHMRRLIPHAQTADVQEAGHMVAGDDNDVFVARLEGFLGEVAPESST